MATVLVRTIPNKDGIFDFVGIFSIDDDGDDDFNLFSVIDEICDPTCCHYLVLPYSSGIFFDLKIETEIYDEDGENETISFNVPVRSRFSEVLNSYLDDALDTDWIPVTDIDSEVVQLF